MLRIIHLFLVQCLFLVSTAFGQGTPTGAFPVKAEEPPPFPFPEEASPQIDDGHFTMQLLNMFFMLGLLIGLLLFVSWFLKRMMHTRIQQVNDSSAIKILEQRAISPKTTVYALDIEGKTYILAETATAITSLQPIENKEILADG
ncbi:hypothetical protein PHSC3_001171 [Chlamydiales bacterium STE3]|nr:hypothetical protein PHSC3_001171 [Chlamydiales bacterium STE3]